jgi:prefoldin subunit 5
MKKVKIHINEHDSFRMYLSEDHFGYYKEVPLELYERYKKVEEEYQAIQSEIRKLNERLPEIDEDELFVDYVKGDKVLRMESKDPIFPKGSFATVKFVNKEDKVVIVELEDGSQFTSHCAYVSKVIE